MKRFFIYLILFFALPFSALADNSSYWDSSVQNNDYFLITDAEQSPELDTTDDITVQLDFQYNDNSGTASYWIATRGGASTQQWGLNFYPGTAGGGDESFYVLHYQSGAGQYDYMPTNISMSPDTWYNIAFTFDASERRMRYYLDGVQIVADVVGADTAFQTRDATLYIGAYFGGAYIMPDGFIDNFRIYNSVLATSSLQENIDCQQTENEEALAFWQFDGDGSDLTANGNDLTEVNTPDYDNTDLPFTSDCGTETATTSTSTLSIIVGTELPDQIPILNDLGVITGVSYHFETSTSTADYYEIFYYHIPIFIWVVILIPTLWIASRVILELIIRFRQ